MRKEQYHLILLILTALLTACSQSPSFVEPTLTEVSIRGNAQHMAVPLTGHDSWHAEPDVEWITPEQQNGEASQDTLYMHSEANPTATTRMGTITIHYATPTIPTQLVQVNQYEATQLIGKPGIEKAAGYSYDVTAKYLEGMRYQIFDITYMDYKQHFQRTHYVEDDNELQSTEEVVTGKTEEALSQQISANASVGLDMLIFEAEMTGNVHYTQLEEAKTAFAMKRTKRLTYTRDIHYANVLADVIKGDTRLFTAGFYADWKELQEMNDKAEAPSTTRLKSFLEKWGKAFVARACLGGTLDMEIEIEEKMLSQSLSIELALEASLAGVINGEVGGKYQQIQEEIKGHYRRYVHIRGGDAHTISILNAGGNITPEQYKIWLNSIYNSDDPSACKVALVDVKVVSIAQLFTGKVKEALDRLINQ